MKTILKQNSFQKMKQILYYYKPLVRQKSTTVLARDGLSNEGDCSSEKQPKSSESKDFANNHQTKPDMKFHNKDMVQATLHSLDTQERLSQSRQNKEFDQVEETSYIIGSVMGKKIFKYIEQVSHLDDVRKSQEKVLQIKECLRDCSENKRDIWRRLHDIRLELHRVQNDLKYNDSKASDRYLQLIKEEIDLYRKEEELQDNFKKADEEEREFFNAFSVAINHSYEKEKIHTNFIKVWGLVSTLVASVITLTGAIISHCHQQSKFASLANDLRHGVHTAVSDNVTSKIGNLEQKMLDNFAKLNGQQKGTSSESWGSYIKRHTRWMYGWVMPKN